MVFTTNDKMEPFDLDLDSSDFTESRIFRAIKRQNHIKVLHAVYSGENVNLRDPEFNSTYIHVICSLAESATEEKYLPMVYQLSNAGIDLNAKDYKGRTALELAIGRELQDIMAALIRCGTDPTEHDYKQMIVDNGSPFEYELQNTVEKYEPGLWSAVSNNDTGMVHMLINSWSRVNISRNGVSLLQMARETGKSQELINVLDDYEVTMEFVHATLAGDEKRMLEFLMDSKPCDPNIMDISYQERWSLPLEPRSLRDTAFCMGHMHILHLLPEDESNGNDLAPMTSTGDLQRPVRHIRDKGRTVTCMAITSLNGYTPGSDAMSPLGNIGEDEDSANEDDPSTMQEVPDEQPQSQYYKRVGSARSEQYRVSFERTEPQRPVNDIQYGMQVYSEASKQQGNITPQMSTFGLGAPMVFPGMDHDNSAAATGGAVEIKQPRDYYFHEVDGFVEQYHVDGAAPPFKTYVCRPNGSDSIKSGQKKMSKSDKHSMKSKLCVIS